MPMSAFLVKDETINRIVTWLKREVAISLFIIDQLAREYDVDLTSDKWNETLANAMFHLNCDGVTARYGAGETEKLISLDFTYKPEPYSSKVQVIKSLQCWMYQYNEGDVPETKLY